MKKVIRIMSTVLQYAITALLAVFTMSAFMMLFPAGIVMLLSTLLICPFTRNKGIKLIHKILNDKILMGRVKGWMYAVSAFVLVVVAFGMMSGESTSQTQDGESEHVVQRETSVMQQNELDEEAIEESTEIQAADMEVHYIDVGQGDATLIKADEQYMLIDAGDNEKGSAVQLYLQKQGVEKLDYLVLTHTDADHIGGADVIITKFEIDTVFLGDFKKENKTYEELVDAFAYKGLTYTTPEVGSEYKLGNASFKIVAPNKEYNDSNNNSIALLLENGDNRFLFTGDCEEEAEKDILANGLNLACDVYKLGHHGSNTSSSEAFLNAVAPTYGVISCAEGNTYGYPHAEPMNHLRGMGVEVFRTDEQGSIIAYSDGTDITWNCAPSESWQVGEKTKNSIEKSEVETPIVSQETVAEDKVVESQAEPPASEVQQNDYVIGNKNTKAFHRPTCNRLPKEKNRVIFNNREEALASGYYNPCDYCNP